MSSSSARIASLASSSVARGCGVPLGRIVSLSMLVFSSTLAMSAVPSSKSSRPAPASKPSMRGTDGRATSASISITVLSSSAAMLIARLIAVKLLPSPASALVTMIRLPCLRMVAPLPMAFVIKGRLITRYWSAARDRGALGVTMPAARIAFRSRVTCLDEGAGSFGSCTFSKTGVAAGVADSAEMPDKPGDAAWGTSTPARRSCSNRSAACSIRLLMASTLSGREDRHSDQYDGEDTDQAARREHESQEVHLLAPNVGLAGDVRHHAQQRQRDLLAQLAHVMKHRAQLIGRERREQAGAQGEDHRERHQQQAVRRYGFGRDSRRVDEPEISDAGCEIEVTRHGRGFAPGHQVLVILLVDGVVAIELRRFGFELRRAGDHCSGVVVARLVFRHACLERGNLHFGGR